MKTYKSNTPHAYCRIGKSSIKIEFKNGLYSTNNQLFQRAIENSPAFQSGEIVIL